MRAAALRFGGNGPALAAAAICFCALFFSAGFSDAPLVWIGGAALLATALLLYAPRAELGTPGWTFLGCISALAVWEGLSTIWSISPDLSWAYTNRSIVYAAFASLGILAGARISRSALAAGALTLLSLVVGWALLAKCIPGLYPDYGRIARLRAPLDYWNELALLCDIGVPLALWLVVTRKRAEGTVLLYAFVLALLLTYSRFGVVLAGLVVAAWIGLERDRFESIAATALAGAVGAAAFGIALALPGVTSDGQPRSVRMQDGLVFLLVVLAGAALVYVGWRLLERHPVAPEHRVRVERLTGGAALVLAVGGLVVSIAFAGRIWNEFTNPAQLGFGAGRLGSASSSNRWTWWQEAWHAFTRHPGGGTGAGTFELTNQMLRRAPVVVDEPHNTPLQFLSETGVVGFLLFLGVAVSALWGVFRHRREAAVTALGLGVAAFFAHSVVDKDWNYLATCGPVLFVAGALLARAPEPAEERARSRRPLLAVCALAVALAALYSLAAPWLAQRQLVLGTAAGARKAHAYDPLSVDALLAWAAFEDASGRPLHAARLYRDAVALEPENADAWYELGSFYFSHGRWQPAYEALNNAYTYDRLGPAGAPCGLLDQARKKATGYSPPNLKCPARARPSSPSGSSG